MVITSTLKRLFLLSTLTSLFAFAQPALSQDVAEGEKLFSENCASCHSIDGPKGLGPNLRDVNKRHKPEWLLKWVKNAPAMIQSGDPEAVKLYEENNKQNMTVFANLSDNQIKSVLKYIETAPIDNGGGGKDTATAGGGGGLNGGGGSASSGGFYTTSNLVVLSVLAVVLLVIGFLMVRVKSILNTLLSKKYPEEVVVKPSWYETKFLPWFKDLNPTIATLVVLGLFIVVCGGFYFKYANTEIGVQQGYAPTQPIAFDHSLHAGQYKIDCQFCHSTASTSKQASVPSVNTCMNCHKHVDAAANYGGKTSPEIQKIRDAAANNTPIKWVRIHNLPDLAYFNHAQHVSVGKVACQACHGEVEKMKKVEQVASLQMGWCVNCHREAQVDVANNDYYEELHKNLKGMNRKGWTVAQNGGLECGKCHY